MPPRTRNATSTAQVTPPPPSHNPPGPAATVLPLLNTPFANEADTGPTRRPVENIKKTVSAQLSIPGARVPGGSEYTMNALKISAHLSKKIDAFLESTLLYDRDSQRWVTIPREPEDEDELYEVLVAIFQSIFDTFGYINRRAVNTSKQQLEHTEKKKVKRKVWTSPDIVIEGCDGKAFHNEDFPEDGPSYASCVASIEVKCHKNMNANERILQIGVYAR